MTVGTEHTNWQQHHPAPDSHFARCSPNILSIEDVLSKRWGMTPLGCYGWRPIRAGTEPSTHGFGGATDRRYGPGNRNLALAEILPWLIDNSAELHVGAIHDYFASRIWHAGRTANVDDAHTTWWKAQPPNPANGMGQAWAVYFHIETTIGGWSDATSAWDRAATPIPGPTPTPIPGGFMHTTVKQGDTGEAVFTVQMFCRKYAGNTDVVVDGSFGVVTTNAVKAVQAWYGLTADGVVGPKTWAKLNEVINS